MTWEGGKARWRKMHQGKWHYVTCHALGAPKTKAGSYLAANEWWRQKLAGLTAKKEPYPAQAIRHRLSWALDHGKHELSQELQGTLEDIIEFPEGAYALTAENMVDAAVWQDRLENRLLPPTQSDRRVGFQVNAWIAAQESRVHIGDMSPGQCENLAHCLRHFQDFVGKEITVDHLTGNTLEAYYQSLAREVSDRRTDGGGKSRDYAAKHLAVARRFFRWLWSRELIDLPRNIDSKEVGFKKVAKPIPTMTAQEARNLIDGATGQLRLHLLLMLNCGMTQSDIADLQDSEVDWDAGRIVRKRGKTKDHDDVPMVDYLLWPMTFDLLKKYRSGGSTVLLTKSGSKWAWEERGDDCRYHSSDSIATNYRRLQGKLKTTKSLKLFRKTSATMLESHREYGRFTAYFLGHSPRSVKDKHYAVPSRALFDEAVKWLGEQFGF